MADKFPENFLWGASTAAHQAEGNQRNNWSRWESEIAEQLAESAKDRLEDVVPDWELIKDQASKSNNYISGIAADHYRRYEEDFDIMERLNFNAYRFSVEWSRIEPEPGRYDQEALHHYRRMVLALKRRGIEPILCLHHFTDPIWLEESDGWYNPAVVEYFAGFAAKVAEYMGRDVRFYITDNEPGTYLLMRYLGGGIWPKWPMMEANMLHGYRYLRNVIKSHRAAYRRIKEVNPEAQVGMAHGVVNFSLERRDPFTLAAKAIFEYLPVGYLLNRLKNCTDLIGVNYYINLRICSKLRPLRQWAREGVEGAPKNDLGWSIYPEGIYHVTQHLKKYDLPMIVTENGLPDTRDRYRAEFIEEHLHWLYKSIEDGADIRGYLHWSLLDNYEWSEGFWPQFGLVAVDRNTMERKVRPSAYIYRDLIERYTK